MKKRIVNMILSAVLMAVIGSNVMMVNDAVARDSITSNSITKSDVVQGIEIIKAIRDSVQVHHIKTREDFDRLTPIIETRNGRIIIEVSSGTVIDDNGNGTDICGYYRHYDNTRFSKGDRVQSVFIYNPETNSFDDIVCRMDTLVE